MTQRYEVLMLSVPEITKDETVGLEKSLDGIIRGSKGSTVSFERWGKYKLAYPVRKNDYGVYFLARLEVPSGSTLHEELKSFFAIKVNDVVMRNLVARLDVDASLEYQRPRSLEEAPTSRDVDTFLKANKMEGLLPSGAAKSSKAEGKAVAETAVAAEAPQEVPEAPVKEAPATEDVAPEEASDDDATADSD